MALGDPVAATTVGVRENTAVGPLLIQTVHTDDIAGCLMCRTKSNRQLMIIGSASVGVRTSPRESWQA